jgi:hypothetical protein
MTDTFHMAANTISDEDVLIRSAIRKRRARRSGRNMFATLGVAVIFGLIGWATLFQLRPAIKAIPLLPTGSILTILLVVGLAAFAIAALLVAGAVIFANPTTPWGKAIPGTCPRCEQSRLREDTVQPIHLTNSSGTSGPKGIVILCDTRGCNYAVARVTTAARA